jgi:hypothetical protein
MNTELIVSYLRFLLQTRGLQCSLVKVRESELRRRHQTHRMALTSKH